MEGGEIKEATAFIYNNFAMEEQNVYITINVTIGIITHGSEQNETKMQAARIGVESKT
jgi:hypothetical protein